MATINAYHLNMQNDWNICLTPQMVTGEFMLQRMVVRVLNGILIVGSRSTQIITIGGFQGMATPPLKHSVI